MQPWQKKREKYQQNHIQLKETGLDFSAAGDWASWTFDRNKQKAWKKER